jgi:hypothetical protein
LQFVSKFCYMLPRVLQLLNMSLCRYQRAKPVIIDPGLYSLQKSDVFWITEKRSVPTAFKLFTGKYSIISPENSEIALYPPLVLVFLIFYIHTYVLEYVSPTSSFLNELKRDK